MAKSTNFFGLRRGSTKSLTFQVYKGLQITKDRVTDVSNPQTQAQMEQRLKVPLVAAARSVLKTLVDHSFEGVTYGDESLKNFSSLNLQSGKLNVASYVPKGITDPGLADFIISTGSLTPYTVNNDGLTLTNAVFAIRNTQTITVPTGTAFSKKASEMTETEYANTFGVIISALGLEENAQCTLLACYQGDGYDYTSSTLGEVIGHYHRFVISRIINTREKMSGWTGSLEDGAVHISDGYLDVRVSTDTANTVFVENVYKSSAKVEAACAIYSRQDDNVWKRSSQRLVILRKETDHFDYADVISSYLKSSGSTSSKYLNTGIDGVSITGGSSSVSQATNDGTSTN